MTSILKTFKTLKPKTKILKTMEQFTTENTVSSVVK